MSHDHVEAVLAQVEDLDPDARKAVLFKALSLMCDYGPDTGFLARVHDAMQEAEEGYGPFGGQPTQEYVSAMLAIAADAVARATQAMRPGG
jgi:hypothetical protein